MIIAEHSIFVGVTTVVWHLGRQGGNPPTSIVLLRGERYNCVIWLMQNVVFLAVPQNSFASPLFPRSSCHVCRSSTCVFYHDVCCSQALARNSKITDRHPVFPATWLCFIIGKGAKNCSHASSRVFERPCCKAIFTRSIFCRSLSGTAGPLRHRKDLLAPTWKSSTTLPSPIDRTHAHRVILSLFWKILHEKILLLLKQYRVNTRLFWVAMNSFAGLFGVFTTYFWWKHQ